LKGNHLLVWWFSIYFTSVELMVLYIIRKHRKHLNIFCLLCWKAFFFYPAYYVYNNNAYKSIAAIVVQNSSQKFDIENCRHKCILGQFNGEKIVVCDTMKSKNCAVEALIRLYMNFQLIRLNFWTLSRASTLVVTHQKWNRINVNW
jgi:hypothetical protein